VQRECGGVKNTIGSKSVEQPSKSVEAKASSAAAKKQTDSEVDAVNSPWWTLSMTIVWIVSRDMHAVSSMFSEGVSRLNVFDAVAELPVGGREAERELFYRLQTGQLPAWGVPSAGQMYREIPPIMWLELLQHHVTWGTDDIGTSSDLIALTENRNLGALHTHTYSFTPMPPVQTCSFSKVRIERKIILETWKATSGVETDQQDVYESRAAINENARPGRKADFDWDDARSFTFRLLDEKGDFLISENRVKGWKCQADLERAVGKHLSTLRSRELQTQVDGPRKNTVRPHVKRFAKQWRDQYGRQ
jgi:hypothetical protein